MNEQVLQRCQTLIEILKEKFKSGIYVGYDEIVELMKSHNVEKYTDALCILECVINDFNREGAL